MASAVAERPAVEKEEKPAPYRMPAPKTDDMVRWYPMGDRNARPRLAYVLDVFEATNRIRIFVPSEQLAPIKTPMHVTDPHVEQKPMAVKQESGGAWDFTSEHYRRQEWEANQQAQLDKMTEKMTEVLLVIEREVASVKRKSN